ncbi:hypothetical protein [Aneurinibacillus tyrosinisolvens]|uniref:hypothetical protein n=1 Tax=Aneurinibacillus tyrosinisolvens TaxID=1443435 RepID=UPI00063F083C|nr:hypothetical protein [Aneurinibacillus tyrosinisolvens]
MDPYYIDRSKAIYIANQAFQWNKKKTGVLLYNGMEDVKQWKEQGNAKELLYLHSDSPAM